MDHKDAFNESLDWEWTQSNPDEIELDKLQKSLKNREKRSVLFSAAAVFLVLAVVFFVIIPILEKQFWNPAKNTNNIEFTNDLSLTMIAYSELFTPSQTVNYVYGERIAFATHSLSVNMYENFDPMVTVYKSAVLRRGELEFPDGFWRYASIGYFDRDSSPSYPLSASTQQYYREKLEALPDYVRVRAAVSFPEDLTMEQLMEFAGSLKNAGIEWIGIRNSPEDQQCYPLCGMKPYVGGIVLKQVNEHYPMFDVKSVDFTPEVLETHFKALLQFSQDQIESGMGIDVGYSCYEEYYAGVLAYVEENGVMTYGCYVVCDAKQLLEMLDNGMASQIWPMEAWIDV